MTITKATTHVTQNEALVFERSQTGRRGYMLPALDVEETPIDELLTAELRRDDDLEGVPELSEPDVVRHFTRISTWNYNIDLGLYPLGSCTMKYNSRLNEKVARIPGFANLHALDGVTSDEAKRRKVMLIPDSAHGTNPASAHLSGFTVKTIRSTSEGLTDLEHLRELCAHGDVAGLMLSQPNTPRLFEKNIREICRIVHDAGGLVYMDGANMNALVGFARPGDMGVDVIHLNLHKTFSTPHGG